MDLVKVLDAAIARLPEGDHTQGLRAVKRHIAAAIRHFDREDSGDLDSFTDAIYRTNQAFEGGLKEAYRVLTGKDPTKLSPYQIETYLENNKLIRPRALKQLTRYREDYRNPSAHDYKLDFDADEALLAIVAVCAFTKLLINQIASKIAFRAGSSLPASKKAGTFRDADDFAIYAAEILKEALGSIDDLDRMESDELKGFVDGAFTNNEFNTEPIFDNIGEDDDHPWDNVVSLGEYRAPVEVRVLQDCDLHRSFEFIEEHISKTAVGVVLVLLDQSASGPFSIYTKPSIAEKKIYIVTQKIDTDKLREGHRGFFGDLSEVPDRD